MKTGRFLLFFTAAASSLFAESSAGTSGFQFLKMQVSARAAGMGGAFVAVPADLHALYYNPAEIAAVENRTAALSYQDDLLDLSSGFIGYVHPRLGIGSAGGYILYRNYGAFKRTDASGQELGEFSANSFVLGGAYALSPVENLRAGATIKYIHSAIDAYTASAAAVDIAASFRIPKHDLTLGVGIFNLGTQLTAFLTEKYPLPLQVRAGFSKRLAHLPLLYAVNFYKYNDSRWLFALGGEFTLTPSLFLRFGYDRYGAEMAVDSSKDTLAGAAVGLGFIWQKYAFDYSFTSLGALGSLNRFTFSGHF
ncbi:MAG: PorV/PorQ family protein [candidate division KSB1 bacterium]|nr:PorV/PorQ family protein [candidate division KSB1 bacterium]